MINSIVGDCAPGNLPTISYQFEEDSFLTIQQLIQHYQYQGKPVTVVSGALLKNPISRSMPLSYYDTKYGALINFSAGAYATPSQSPKPSPFVTPVGSPRSSPEMNRHKPKWTGSQPILNITDVSENVRKTSSGRRRESRSSSLDRCDSLPVINVTPPVGKAGSEAASYQDGSRLCKPVVAHMRAGSAPVLTPENLSNGNEVHKFSTLGRRLVPASSESELTNPPPPKPSRIPSIKYRQKPTVVVRKAICDDDRDYSDYTQVKEEPSWLHGSTESIPKFQDESSRQIHSFSSDETQKGRRATRVTREKMFIPSPGNNRRDPNANTPPSFPGLHDIQKGRQNLNSRVPPIPTFTSDVENSPASPTYQIVARSRSFQSPGHDDADYDNNMKNDTRRGYQTLPIKSSSTKTPRGRLTSDTESSQVERSSSDYDYPKEHIIDDRDIFGFYDVEYMKSRKITKPPKNCQSAIMPEAFKSTLLPKGHKVLDQTVLLNVKALILNKTPRTVALHLTKYDLTLMNITEEIDLGLGVTSGLELLTLPQGKQLRQDVIERWESLRMFTLVMLLTCQTVNERAKILSLWIQTCLELKTTVGNLYSFAAIMSALTSPQIMRLTDTWLILRQNHTASAYTFDTKLRPGFVSLNDASSDLPLNNVCVPYVTPVCQLLERDVQSVLQEYYWEKGLDPVGSAIDVLLAHLDTARVIASQCNLYQVTGKAHLTGIAIDAELVQILCSEFHLLLLWGEKGWMVNRRDRLDKLEQIFTLLSQKYQVPGDDGTEV